LGYSPALRENRPERKNSSWEVCKMNEKPENKFRVETLAEGKVKTQYFKTYNMAEAHYLMEVKCGNPASVAEYLITPHNKWCVIKEEPPEAWKKYRENEKK
jgi:hypothetical protein